MANPILHMVNAFRYGFLGTSDVNVVGAFAIMIVLVVALYRVGAGAAEPGDAASRD